MSNEKQFYTYVHCRPDGTPFYIGKGHGKRAYEFKDRNDHHKCIVAKHGKENIIVEVMPCKSEAEAFLREQLAIKALRLSGIKLCNQTDGGEGSTGLKFTDDQRKNLSLTRRGCLNNFFGKSHSEETRAKIVAARKLQAPMSDESRRKISEANKGRAPWITGKNHSVETRNKMSCDRKGRKPWNSGTSTPDVVKRKISKALIGHIFSDETRVKLSAAAKGNKNGVGRVVTQEVRRKMAVASVGNNHATGRHHTLEARKKISAARKKYWEDKKVKK